MFETHFGFTAPPFQLSPDPAFYFPSKGHGKALAYLKYGVHQGEGFIVVTGDVGSGKTTLVQALQKSLPPGKVVVAQVVSTQLDDHGLYGADELDDATCDDGAMAVNMPGTLLTHVGGQ